MTLLSILLLALAGGITSILPVSGSGHLHILEKLLGLAPDLAQTRMFTAMTLFGVALALGIFYRAQVGFLLSQGLVLLGVRRPDHRLRGSDLGTRPLMLLLVALLFTLPGLLLRGAASLALSKEYLLVLDAICLGLGGTLLYSAERWARLDRTEQDLLLPDAVSLGLAQAASILPGLGRSSLTFSAGLLRGLNRSDALEFSGLLGLPAVLGAAVLELISAMKLEGEKLSLLLCVATVALSAAAALGTLRVLTARLQYRRATLFAYWSWGAALFALVLFLISA